MLLQRDSRLVGFMDAVCTQRNFLSKDLVQRFKHKAHATVFFWAQNLLWTFAVIIFAASKGSHEIACNVTPVFQDFSFGVPVIAPP